MTGGPARTRSRLAAALLSLGVMALLAGCGGSSSKPPPKPVADLTPKQILTQTLASARSAGSLHYDEQVTVSSVTVDAVGDAQLTVGRQSASGSNGAVMDELVLPGATYIRGNAAALTGFLGMKARKASRYANRWLVLHASDANYQQITQGIAGDSLLSSVIPVGSLTKAKPQKIGSQSVIGVVGTAPASSDLPAGSEAELWVATTGKPLPVAAEELGTDGDKIELTFTRSLWGEKVTGVAAPAGAVAYPAG
jgi:hypothetical protein